MSKRSNQDHFSPLLLLCTWHTARPLISPTPLQGEQVERRSTVLEAAALPTPLHAPSMPAAS